MVCALLSNDVANTTRFIACTEHMHFLIRRLHAHHPHHVTSILLSLELGTSEISVLHAEPDSAFNHFLRGGTRCVVGDCSLSVLGSLLIAVHHSPCDVQSALQLCNNLRRRRASRSRNMMSDANPSTQPWRSMEPCVPVNRAENLPPSTARQKLNRLESHRRLRPNVIPPALWRIAPPARVQR